MSLLMEALRKAEEAKRKSLEQEGTLPATAAPDAAPAAAEAPPVAEAATLAEAPHLAARPSTATGTRSLFSLEPREPTPPPPPLRDPEPESAAPAPLQQPEPGDLRSDAGPAVVIAAPRDEIEDYLSADLAPEDNSPLPRGKREQRRARERDRLAAASVFAAKQAAAPGPKRSRTALLLGLGLTVIALGGSALWYQLQAPASGLTINPSLLNQDLASRGFLEETPAGNADTPVAPEPSAGEAPAAVPANESAATSADSSGEPAPEVVSDASSTLPAPEAGSIALASPGPAPAVPGTMAPPVPATTAVAAPAAPPAPGGPEGSTVPATGSSRTLQISRSTGRSATNGTLQAAWEQLQAGELQRAALLYQEVLAEQPGDRDAMIGLAAIHLRNGEFSAATGLYTQVLTLNPQDPYAQAGLLQATRGGNDPAYEAELRNLLQRHPAMPPLHFALGNYYAGQQRWSEAQTAYFEALLQARRDSSLAVSPDYAFNLAVSLERLQQPGAALNYYRQAEELARATQPGFDPALLRSRINALQELPQP